MAGTQIEWQTSWQVVVSGSHPSGGLELDTLIKSEAVAVPVAETCCDDAAFWLYTSGSTGTPKGVIHHQSDLIQTASLYGDQVLGIRPDDRVFSAAKLFFAYGLGLLFAGQAMINIGVNIGLLPTKGLTLPFLSYGGASLIVSCFMVALLVRIQYETECFSAREVAQ